MTYDDCDRCWCGRWHRRPFFMVRAGVTERHYSRGECRRSNRKKGLS